MFESGAILLYLASKTGRFLPEDPRDKWSTMQWLMFQMGGVGPMLGQAHHFLGYAPEKIPYAMNRYKNEANRLYGVIDRRLQASKYIACGEYTIADMAIVPWLRFPDRQGVEIGEYPALKSWRDAILERPAVQRALKVLADRRRAGPHSDKEREILFGATQYAKR
jgi:GST-like protein